MHSDRLFYGIFALHRLITMRLFLLKRIIRRREEKRSVRGGANYLKDDTRKLKSIYERIERLMAEKEPYLDGDFSVEDLSAMVGVSRSMTSKALSRIGKKNFRPYINGYRIKYAAQLIKNEPRMRFSEVARMSGFNSLPSFNSWFKLETSKRPSEYLIDVWEAPQMRFSPKRKE